MSRSGCSLPVANQSITLANLPQFSRDEWIASSLLVIFCWMMVEGSPEKPMMPMRAAGEAISMASPRMLGWQGAVAVMAQIRPGFLAGGEVRYLGKYEGIGLEEFAGQALFVGPTAYLQLSERSRLTIAWSAQAWGRAAGSTAALDLVNFERHQARLIFGVNF